MDSTDSIYFYHLRPTTVDDKELFYSASRDIDHSFTGRIDMLGLHNFFIEASLLIRNAVRLYEQGFFDAAFYSVRSAVELSRIVTYFSDIDNPKDSEVFKNWTSGGKFPFDSRIKEELERSSDVYQEVRGVLGSFFDEQAERLRASQKYIHKQGFKTFYDRGFTNDEREKKRIAMMTQDFNAFTKNSLAEIALLRLCVDPFPLLLNDPDVMYKIHFESMTEPFSDDMVDKIIGKANVALYRSTDFYTSIAAYYDDNEALSEEAHTLINHQFYDRKSRKIIERQFHLLSKRDQSMVKMFNESDEISHIYASGGLEFYFSDVKSTRTKFGFSGSDFQVTDGVDKKLNTDYDGAFLSHIYTEDEDYWIEHNRPLKPEEFLEIQKAAL